jgi:Spy/CpxP family protein refolding chaperone
MSLKSIGAWVGVAALALVCTTSARAQGGRGMGMMGMGGGPMAGVRVLTTPEGEKELNITADQKTKLQEMTENIQANMREKFQSMREELQDASPEERTEKMQALQRELSVSVNKDLKEILNADQLKRFQQINLQAQGFMAFNNPELQEKLKFTAEQKSQLKEVTEEFQTAQRDAFQQMQDDREAGRAAMTKASEAAREKAMKMLTSEQKAAWEEMTGKPFKMPAMQPPGQRRRAD